MPYEVYKQGDVWVVRNKDTGKSHGKHDSREKAIAQMRLLYGVEHGMKPR